MTRDQAIRKLNMLPIGASCGFEPWLIDALVSLNMLKLDEPKSIRDKLVDLLGRKDWTASDVDEFRGCICAAGLRIVEK